MGRHRRPTGITLDGSVRIGGVRACGLTDGATFLAEIDLGSGATVRRIELPRAGQAVDLAATDRWVFVANPFGSELWMVDRRHGAVVRSIRVSKGSVAFAHSELPWDTGSKKPPPGHLGGGP